MEVHLSPVSNTIAVTSSKIWNKFNCAEDLESTRTATNIGEKPPYSTQLAFSLSLLGFLLQEGHYYAVTLVALLSSLWKRMNGALLCVYMRGKRTAEGGESRGKKSKDKFSIFYVKPPTYVCDQSFLCWFFSLQKKF